MGRRINEKVYFYIRRGSRKHIRRLLKKHPDLLMSDEAMLAFTAIWHNRSMLRWLLERGVSPDGRIGTDGNTPLMQAASDGDPELMQLLLEFGADVNALNEESENPLGFEVAWKQLESIRILVAAGADVNDITDSGPERTQLDIAEFSGWTEVAALLRSLGAKRFSEL
ncbi:Ankyrin repeat protein [Thalassoglobus neptunius]|uniref:Ankyrin repeat protein n=1 Tax=Thalassoglobus neptunius TaxID=1938619 RepID=A0A5C5VI73_9PLAN|nr:ankyrin repeat domain-containing protein [Thalassoglobus neptunius]TWT38306.1 Ankyrin repeat protein [Thalassoglobus neptunius]